MNILVAGAGYIGLPLALALKTQGHQVWGWVYSDDSAAAVRHSKLEPICGDLAEEKLWQSFPFSWDAIFYCPSTSGGGAESYERIHRSGLQHALKYLSPNGRIFYTSSTSVYGQDDGSEVNESASTEPKAEGSKILVEAEKKVLERNGTVLRLAGIYGPGRCVYLQKLREGRATIPGDGKRWVNQIHQSDAVAALLFLWVSPTGGGVWNGADDESVSIRYMYEWLCRQTGLPFPAENVVESSRKRGLTHKRVLNGKLKKAGWSPQYPSFREGYRDLIRMKADGEI